LKTILIRTLSGGIYTLLILGSILLGPVFFGILLYFFMLLSLIEFAAMATKSGVKTDVKPMIFAASFCYIVAFLFALNHIPAQRLLFCLPVLFFPFISELFRQNSNLTGNIGFGLLSFTYIVIPFILLNFLFYPEADLSDQNMVFVLGFFILTWTYDTFAYLCGMWLGRHKLFERISPKKTWEGTIGGTLFSILGAWIFSMVYPEYSFFVWLGFALTIIIFGTFGDLVESMFKRSVGVKDSGSLMPGHGGILDRMDSIILSVPFVLVYLNIVFN
jgi:phosphatidate cytidylyltransferase